MAIDNGYEPEVIPYVDLPNQTIYLNEGIRLRKTTDNYVLERLKSDLTWESLAQAGGSVWGQITGDPTDQTDLQDALALKQDAIVVSAPAAADSSGVAGTIAFDSGFIYVCVGTDTWKRVAIATWP